MNAAAEVPEAIDRRTHERANHPKLGPGWAIYDNGPACFIADSGEREDFERIGFGGASQTRSYLSARRGSERVELDTTGLPRGTRHERVIRDDGTPGWLVAIPDDDWTHEFQPDEGKPVSFQVLEMFVGRPDERNKRSKKALEKMMQDDWRTMKARSGMFFTYRPETRAA